MRRILLLPFFVLFVTVHPAKAQNLHIESLVITRSVENRQPVGIDSVFSSSVQTLYCFTHITGATDTTHISHVWYYGDQELSKIDLPVRSPNWHTWSSKTIPASLTGLWHVNIVDSGGNILGTRSFRINGSSNK